MTFDKLTNGVFDAVCEVVRLVGWILGRLLGALVEGIVAGFGGEDV